MQLKICFTIDRPSSALKKRQNKFILRYSSNISGLLFIYLLIYCVFVHKVQRYKSMSQISYITDYTVAVIQKYSNTLLSFAVSEILLFLQCRLLSALCPSNVLYF